MNAETLSPAARIDNLLRSQSTVWLSTVAVDGTPHLVPIWFSWDGERLFIASKPHARKVRNLRDNPRLMLALGDPDEDFDVGLVEAQAEIPSAPTCDVLPPDHLAKYERQMRQMGLAPAEYVETYSQPVIVRPTRFLPWHGRSIPASALAPSSETPPPLRRAVERLLAPLGLRRAVSAAGA
jgi:PPOX class probable F420-dependent enzyme